MEKNESQMFEKADKRAGIEFPYNDNFYSAQSKGKE